MQRALLEHLESLASQGVLGVMDNLVSQVVRVIQVM